MRRVLLLAVLIAVAASCGGDGDDSAETWPGAPVVLISIDTLRADRLPMYGYDTVDTPHLDALRADGVLFERAYSHVPLTLPSHSSLFTGLLPSEHGVRDNRGYELDGENLPLIQKSLKEAGYVTGGAVSSAVLLEGTGIETGFDFYSDEIKHPKKKGGLGALQRPGMETLEKTIPWLREVYEEPFYLFFHIYEPHDPHTPPEPFASRYGSPYDGEVAAADAIIGSLLDELKRLGVYDRAFIVLLSDHGEGLHEHDENGHGIFLYTATLHVPLVMKLPGSARAGESVGEPVQLADVYPTIATLVGVDVPEGLSGQPLLAGSAGPETERVIYSESYFARLQYGWNELLSVVRGRYHYVDGPEPELFDLQEDPGETRNLVDDLPDVGEDLRRQVDSFRTGLEGPGEIDPEMAERLAALGYVGGAKVTTEGILPDPRTRKQALRRFQAAFRHWYNDEFEMVVSVLPPVLEKNPQVRQAWDKLAGAFAKLGRNEEAIGTVIEGLKHNPDSPELAWRAARLFFQTRRYGQAREHAELLLDGNLAEQAHVLLADIAVREGRLDDAERNLELAGESGRGEVRRKIIRAEIHLGRKHFGTSLAQAQEVEALVAERKRSGADEGTVTVDDPLDTDLATESGAALLKGLYYVKGESLANLGRTQEAEAAFRREIELYPDELRTYTHLGVLYMVLGRPEDGHRTLQEMLRANPTAVAHAEAVKTLRIVGDRRTADLVLRRARTRFPGDPALQGL